MSLYLEVCHSYFLNVKCPQMKPEFTISDSLIYSINSINILGNVLLMYHIKTWYTYIKSVNGDMSLFLPVSHISGICMSCLGAVYYWWLVRNKQALSRQERRLVVHTVSWSDKQSFLVTLMNDSQSIHNYKMIIIMCIWEYFNGWVGLIDKIELLPQGVSWYFQCMCTSWYSSQFSDA